MSFGKKQLAIAYFKHDELQGFLGIDLTTRPIKEINIFYDNSMKKWVVEVWFKEVP